MKYKKLKLKCSRIKRIRVKRGYLHIPFFMSRTDAQSQTIAIRFPIALRWDILQQASSFQSQALLCLPP